MERIKIGVIGSGNMGSNHIRVLSTMPNEFDLVGFCEVDENKIKKIKEKYRINHYKKLFDLLQYVDAVIISLATTLHLEYAYECASKGKHILVEKPIANTSEEAEKLVSICKKNNVNLFVGHIERYNPVIRELKKIITKEEIISYDFRRLSPFDKRIFDTDVVKDLMIHDIDILTSLINANIKSMNSHGVCIYTNLVDYAQSIIAYENGVLASLTASRITETKIRQLEINTKKAYILVDYLNRKIEISRKTNFSLDVGHSIEYKQENIREIVYVPFDEPLRNELVHFAFSIANREIPETNGETSTKAIKMCERILNGIYNN